MKEDTINRINITKHLIEYELEMIGKKLVDILDVENYTKSFSMTRNQYNQFHSYAIPLLKKTFKIRKSIAEDTFEWYWKMFGIQIKN